ncbi:hypothetical protein [Streptomyces sp. NPDC007088]|uniref:hypothetical protein n=1 Tax=Streptomyces sp. NPDC007088 TaxID=3364773 RepID=UPI003685F668
MVRDTGRPLKATQQATDAEVEMAALSLEIASAIERLVALAAQHGSHRFGVTRATEEESEMLRARVQQAALLTQCPVLARLVEDDAAARGDHPV